MNRSDEEHKIQVGIIRAVECINICKWLHAIPNGGNRSAATGARLKAEGVKRGIADLFLPVPRPKQGNHMEWYSGLYLEVKSKKGKQTTEQKEFEKECNLQGYKYEIVRSSQHGVDAIIRYLNWEKCLI